MSMDIVINASLPWSVNTTPDRDYYKLGFQHDSKERINKCLSCEKLECDGCKTKYDYTLIARLLSQGKSNKEICTTLGMTSHALSDVKKHLRRREENASK